jgi:hypothetical protein
LQGKREKVPTYQRVLGQFFRRNLDVTTQPTYGFANPDRGARVHETHLIQWVERIQMIRKIKVLGLALVAVLAMSAVGASASQAFEFTAFNKTSGLHEHGTTVGEQIAGETHKFTPTGGFASIQCTKAHFTGTAKSGTEATPTTHPEYSGCTDSFGRTVHVTTTGCDYQFHVTAGSADKFTGTSDIVCAAGKNIIVQITSGGSVICTDTIGSQTGNSVIDYENLTAANPRDIRINSTVTNVKNTVTGSFFNCGTTEGLKTNGTYTGNTTVKAFNTAGKQIDLEVK